jgi:hypothetical protein
MRAGLWGSGAADHGEVQEWIAGHV